MFKLIFFTPDLMLSLKPHPTILLLTDGSGGDLHECWLWREHPAEEEEEEGVVAEGDHRLDHPEDGLVVAQQVLPCCDVWGQIIFWFGTRHLLYDMPPARNIKG